MTTAAVPIQITCPNWFTRTAGEHVDDLWNMDGDCIHFSGERMAVDAEGYCEALRAPVFHPRVDVWMTSMTSPDGRETASPIVHLCGQELSVQQALAFSELIREVVYTYRVAGGQS